ncbi:hypothetical protein QBC41DRAFT_188156, partial [Cercophora samala]
SVIPPIQQANNTTPKKRTTTMSTNLIPNTAQDAGADNSYVSRPGHKHEPMQVIPDDEARNEVNNNNNQRQRANTSGDQL